MFKSMSYEIILMFVREAASDQRMLLLYLLFANMEMRISPPWGHDRTSLAHLHRSNFHFAQLASLHGKAHGTEASQHPMVAASLNYLICF